jgi:16S rRNA (guanine1516-N2)-methyltransferase
MLQLKFEERFLSVDFVNDKRNYLKLIPKGKQELIAKAIGLNKANQTVIDATAGLLQDSILLSRLGAQIRAVEKSDLIFALIADAYKRGQEDHACKLILSRIAIFHDDAYNFLSQLKLEDYPDVVYLDPMFPENKKTALPRLEMQIFRKIVDVGDDYERILQMARKKVKSRVVVKRPLKGAPLSSGWQHQIKGNTVRFDIYPPMGISANE